MLFHCHRLTARRLCSQGHAQSGRQGGLGRRGRLPDAAQNLRTRPAPGARLQVLATGHAARFPGCHARRRRLSDGVAQPTVELFVGAGRAGTHAGAAQRLNDLFLIFFFFFLSLVLLFYRRFFIRVLLSLISFAFHTIQQHAAVRTGRVVKTEYTNRADPKFRRIK